MVATPTIWRPQTIVGLDSFGLPPVERQSDPQILGLPDGGYVIVWTDDDRNNTAIRGQQYDALGARVGGSFGLTGHTDYRSPAITGLPDGGYAVAYVHFLGDIYVQRVTGSASVVDTIDASAAVTLDPALTSFSDGSYVVAYTVGSGADTDIAARVVSATGVVGAQFFIHDETDNSGAPQVATLSDGNFVAVYQDEDNGGATNIAFRIFQPNTTAVTAPTTVVGGDGPENEINPNVAALRDGGFVVVWADDFGSYQYDVSASIYDNTGAAVRLNIPIFSTGFAPDVLALADGGFLVTGGATGSGSMPMGTGSGSNSHRPARTPRSSPAAGSPMRPPNLFRRSLFGTWWRRRCGISARCPPWT